MTQPQRKTYHEVIPIARPSNFVEPLYEEAPQPRGEIAPADAGIVGSVINYAMQAINSASSRTAQTDSADTLANAYLKSSAPPLIVFFLIAAGGCGIVAYFLRTQVDVSLPWGIWLFVFLLAWGGMTFLAIRDNHTRIMDHSGSGVERLRITEGNQTARHIVDRSFDALERKWGVRRDE